MNQLSFASSPSVAEVKIQARRESCASSLPWRKSLSCTALAMSSGDSTRRSWVPTSTQRTDPGGQARAKLSARWTRTAARSCRRTKSGAISLNVSSTSMAPAQAWRSASSASSQGCTGTWSGASPAQRSLAPGAVRPTTMRRSRAALSTAATTVDQSANPRANWSPAARVSRAKSSSCPVVMWWPRNCTPVSLSWWASSKIATRTVGSSSAMPDSRTARSAKNRWWLITTTSAASASRRARLTWQPRNLGHCMPRQFSRVEVTRGISGERSSRPGSSARSPVRVVSAQSSIFASERIDVRSASEPSVRASSIRCRHR